MIRGEMVPDSMVMLSADERAVQVTRLTPEEIAALYPPGRVVGLIDQAVTRDAEQSAAIKRVHFRELPTKPARFRRKMRSR